MKMNLFVVITLLTCCLFGLVSGLAPVPRKGLPLSCDHNRHHFTISTMKHHLSMSSSTNGLNYECYNNIEEQPPLFRTGVRKRLSNKVSCMIGRRKSTHDDNNVKSASSPSLFSLFPKRRHSQHLFQTIPTLLFLLLRRVALIPSIAWATSTSTTMTLSQQSHPAAIGRQRILTFVQSILQGTITSLRNVSFNKHSIKRICTIGLLLYANMSLIKAIQAHKRQRVDATSEWGRYSDQPSARGMALTSLMLRLIPYAILPGIIEKITGKNTNDDDDTYNGYNTQEEYESSRAHQLRLKGGKIFANGLLRLGPLYIKIGQILSCRENLFSDEWITAMETLQDQVPAKSGKDAWDLLYDACPGGKRGFHRMFTDFDDVPLAAASLGQVHKARLRGSGDRVAIKIQRSRLRDIYDKDLSLMKKIAKVADRCGSVGQVGGIEQSWEDIFNDAETILYREIDYRDEADNAIRFAQDFGIGLGGEPIPSTAKDVEGKKLPSASDWLRTPYTYKELSSEKFLVMEYVPSIKVSNDAKLDEAGVTVEDREYLAEALAHAYLRQFCTNKFFSTDPHPGNLGVEVFEDDERPPRMVFYDFGQACSLSDDQAGGILEVIESIIDLDAKKSVAAFARMGVLKDNADLEKVQAKCQQNYDTGKLKVKKRKKRKGARYSQNVQKRSHSDELDAKLEARLDDKSTNATKSTGEVKDAEVLDSFTLQSEYAFVARALSQMDGVGKGLDPDFDFISAAAPYIVEVKGTGRYLIDEAKKVLKVVYDEESGMLAKEMKLFKSLGWEGKTKKEDDIKVTG